MELRHQNTCEEDVSISRVELALYYMCKEGGWLAHMAETLSSQASNLKGDMWAAHPPNVPNAMQTGFGDVGKGCHMRAWPLDTCRGRRNLAVGQGVMEETWDPGKRAINNINDTSGQQEQLRMDEMVRKPPEPRRAQSSKRRKCSSDLPATTPSCVSPSFVVDSRGPSVPQS